MILSAPKSTLTMLVSSFLPLASTWFWKPTRLTSVMCTTPLNASPRWMNDA